MSIFRYKRTRKWRCHGCNKKTNVNNLTPVGWDNLCPKCTKEERDK